MIFLKDTAFHIMTERKAGGGLLCVELGIFTKYR